MPACPPSCRIRPVHLLEHLLGPHRGYLSVLRTTKLYLRHQNTRVSCVNKLQKYKGLGCIQWSLLVSNRNHVPITNKKRQHSQSQGSDNSTPRSPPVSLGRSISHSPTEPSYPPFTDDAHDTTHTIKSQRRSSSFEVLHSLAGPDSQLPLPKKEGVIQEGVPSEFSPLREHNKRSSSPTRTLSREIYSLVTIYPHIDSRIRNTSSFCW